MLLNEVTPPDGQGGTPSTHRQLYLHPLARTQSLDRLRSLPCLSNKSDILPCPTVDLLKGDLYPREILDLSNLPLLLITRTLSMHNVPKALVFLREGSMVPGKLS
jgi:hypothetical protein